MAQLVDHRAQPIAVGHDVAQDPDIPFAIDIRTEGVRILALLLVEIAPRNHVVDSQADPLVEVAADLEDVGLGIDPLRGFTEDLGPFLKERVVVVPWTQVLHLYAAIPGQDCVDLRLGGPERRRGSGRPTRRTARAPAARSAR